MRPGVVSGRHTVRGRRTPLWVAAAGWAFVGLLALFLGVVAGLVFPAVVPMHTPDPGVFTRPAIACPDASSTYAGRTWWSCVSSPTTTPPSSPSSTPHPPTTDVEVTTTRRS